VLDDLRREWARLSGSVSIDAAATTLDDLTRLYGKDAPLRPVW
jgi:hypothetical protein